VIQGLTKYRHLFDVPEEIAYFNTANLAPHLHSVRRAGDDALDRRGRPWTIEPADWFSDVERLRALFGRLLGTDAEGVALIPATSYGFAVAARNLHVEPGRRILVLAEEYPSGVYTWQSVARETGAEMLTVKRESGQSWTEAILERLDERVTIVSVPNVHWTDGALIELDRIAARTHQLGARLVIDASQSAGAMPLSVEALDPDFLVTGGYKWLTPMAIAALEQILEWEVPEVAASLGRRTALMAERAERLGLRPLPVDERGPHMLGIELPETLRAATLEQLADHRCYAAIRGRALRLAPHLHITDHDIDRLTTALAEATRVH
jgi:selenocysteine lyase/cysteine desulfurase